jgi:peptidoglycan/xylan/chitin deacetylase (PgdA/CDA1 family)
MEHGLTMVGQAGRVRWAAALVLVASFSCAAGSAAPLRSGSRDGYCERVRRLARDGAIEQAECGVTRGPKLEKKVALVFTAGSFCEGGPTILDALKAHGAKASFFLLTETTRTTDPASMCPVVVPRLAREGHYVGPHSDTHVDLVDRQGGRTTIDRARFDAEIERNLDALRRIGAAGPIRYWMPPSETYNEEIAAWSADRGLATIHLTGCPETQGDYLPVTARGGKFSSAAILGRIAQCERDGPSHLNGAILFFHLGIGPNRPDADKVHHAIPRLLDALTDQGYSFVRIDELLAGSVGAALDTRQAPERDVDYARMAPEDALREKYERMVPFTRNRVEREVLDVAYRGLLEGRRTGRWMDVGLEDLMAHARQESGGVIDALAGGGDVARFHAVGTTAWDFHQLPSNDLNGFISFSVWQTITPNYLWLGKDLSPKIADLHRRYVAPYRLTDAEASAAQAEECGSGDAPRDQRDAFGFTSKMAKRETVGKAKPMFDAMIGELTRALAGEPTLHVEVIAELIARNYRRDGVRSPRAVRSYFWSAIQQNLDPAMWLRSVRYDDDGAPTRENGCLDVNRNKRGDYGKQVVLASSYNDRGMVFWYGVTRDGAALRHLGAAWSSDPARITASDYRWLREQGRLGYADEHPEIYDYVIARLPSASPRDVPP